MKTPEEIREEAIRETQGKPFSYLRYKSYVKGYQSAQSSIEPEIEDLKKQIEWKDARIDDMIDHITNLKKELRDMVKMANGTNQ